MLTGSGARVRRANAEYIIRGMTFRVRVMVLAALLLAAAAATRCSGFFAKQYEYEEDVTIHLDGSATVVVNSSLAALAALRGLDVASDPAVRYDRSKIRAAYESPVADVTYVSRTPWRRRGRRFVQIRLRVPDIRSLTRAAPFSWSRYELTSGGGTHTFTQIVGASALRRGTLAKVGWDGSELVAFRLHLPSRIVYHNARDVVTNETLDVERGNILRWEQQLADRLDGAPLEIQVRMESQSVLYRTLWLFGGAFAAAVALLVLLVWLTLRKGAKDAATTAPSGPARGAPPPQA